jgi:hypothetical protein
MRWIAENRQYLFRIAGLAEVMSRHGRVAMPAPRAFEKVPFDRSIFSDEKSGQTANG